LPTLNAVFDAKMEFPLQYRFRRSNILNVREPSEPDNIIWHNLEVDRRSIRGPQFITMIVSLGTLVLIWYLLMALKMISPRLMSLMIGFLDALLPTVFDALSDMSFPSNEGKKQSRLQSQLFVARFLLTTIFPYLQLSWQSFLTEGFLQQILLTQLAASFFAPIFALLDIYGFLDRHLAGPYFSDTQEEMNNHFVGTQWSLAEKYTGLAKIISIALFYSLLTPISLFIAMMAFLSVLFIDNYLLLRRYKSNAMIDASIATRLRQQSVVAVAIHMVVTLRFVYSWPMDDVSFDPISEVFSIVNKAPSIAPWKMTTEPWQSTGQHKVFAAYQYGMYLVVSIAVYMMILEPVGSRLYKWLFNTYGNLGEMQSIPFSANDKIDIYYPILQQPPLVTTLCGAHSLRVVEEEDFVHSNEYDVETMAENSHEQSRYRKNNRNIDNRNNKNKNNHNNKRNNRQLFSTSSSPSSLGLPTLPNNHNQFSSSSSSCFSSLDCNSLARSMFVDETGLSNKPFLCSFAKNVLPAHRPVCLGSASATPTTSGLDTAHSSVSKDDLSCYVPIHRQKDVLSIVQGFPLPPQQLQQPPIQSPLQPQSTIDTVCSELSRIRENVVTSLLSLSRCVCRDRLYLVSNDQPPTDAEHNNVNLNNNTINNRDTGNGSIGGDNLPVKDSSFLPEVTGIERGQDRDRERGGERDWERDREDWERQDGTAALPVTRPPPRTSSSSSSSSVATKSFLSGALASSLALPRTVFAFSDASAKIAPTLSPVNSCEPVGLICDFSASLVSASPEPLPVAHLDSHSAETQGQGQGEEQQPVDTHTPY
jgi:hypothetical protein